MLQLLELHEDLARRAETARDELLRSAFVRRYRDIFSIDPSLRQDLCTALQNLAGATVMDVLECFDISTQDVNGIV